MTADLHLHTTCSDGRFSPEELAEAASLAGLRTLAVTDHDSTAGVRRVAAWLEERGRPLTVVPGVELSAVWRGHEVHVLGYFVALDDPAWQEALKRQRERRDGRTAAFVQALQAHGLPLTLEEVLAEAAGAAPGRPHLARAMVRKGIVGSEQAAFDRYLSPGTPTWVERPGISPEEAIALIHAAGGVSSLAHPGKSEALAEADPETGARLLDRMVEAGLDAVEVVHPAHPPLVRQYYADLARHYGLALTGGTDDHGPRPGHSSRIGQEGIPESWVDALRRRARPPVTSTSWTGRAGAL